MSAREVERLRRRLYNRVPFIGGWLRLEAAAALARDGSPEAVEALARAVVRSGDEQVREAALEALQTLAGQGRAEAQEALCRLAVMHDHTLARDIALAAGYAPRDEHRRALFLFLAEQFDRYEALDFEEGQPLLRAAYTSASDALKQRVMDTARRSGYATWALAVTRYRVEEISDAEWETALEVLVKGRRWREIWELVFKMPVKWSFETLHILARAERTGEWSPDVLEPWEWECWQELRAFCIDADPRPTLSTEGLLRVLEAHEGSIWALDFSYEGSILATGGRDRTVRLWKMPLGQPLRTLRAHDDWVSCLAFSDRSDMLASGSEDTTVRLWGVPGGDYLGTLRGHDEAVRSVAFHPLRDLLASGGEDRRVCLWRRRAGRPMQEVDAGVGDVLALAFAPDGDTLAAGGKDGGITLWRVEPFEGLRRLGWNPGPVTSLAFSPNDGGKLLAGASEAGMIQVWRADEGCTPVRTLKAPCPVWNLAFSRDGRVLVGGGGDGAIRFWRLQDGEMIRVLRRHETSVWCLRFSPTGWLMASGATGEKSAVNLWWVLREKPLLEVTHRDLEWVSASLRERSDATTEEERRGWRLLEALLRAKFRFDIALEGPKVIPIGEFDIEIESESVGRRSEGTR